MTVVIEDITEQDTKDAQPGTSLHTEQEKANTATSGEQQAAAPSPEENEEAESDLQPGQEDSDAARLGLERAEALKSEGNALFGSGRFEEALGKYAEALEVAPESAASERAVYHGNRAACQLKLRQFADAAQDCSAALELNPSYTKVLLRRSSAYEELDDLERALADAQKVLELEPGNVVATKVVQRLEPTVLERREKLKEEMLGKLKDLGNTILGKFGMSLDNFKAEKDPTTGSYSIKFGQ